MSEPKTRRKRAAGAARAPASDTSLRALADDAGLAILVADAEGLQVFANPQACKLTGYTEKELLAMHMRELVAPEHWERVRSATRRRLRGGGRAVRAYEVEILHKSGRRIPAEVSGGVMQWQGQKASIGFLRDISRTRAQQDALRGSEKRYRMLADNAVDIITRHDTSLICRYISPAVCHVLGFDPDELLGVSVFDVCHSEDKPAIMRALRQLVETRQARTLTARFRHKSGGYVWLESRCKVVEEAETDGGIEIESVSRDISERRRLEQEVLDASLREQRRIGQDLHDSLGQELTGITFMLRALHAELQEQQRPEAAQCEKIMALASQALSHARRVSRGLQPVGMVAEGLAAALEELAEEVTDVHGVDCICSVEGPGLVHDNEVGTHLYYIAREAVHNAVRHGMPTNVRIDLCTNGRDGSLAVRDNGNGFSATEFDRTGIGLRIMQYRAEMIGGHLTITPLPDGGTVLRCTFRDALAATRA